MVFRELKKSLPTCKLLYLTPEQFVKSQHLQSVLRALFDAGLLSRLIVDEAHCISQWGHDFRVDYKNIGSVKKNLFPGLPAMALTATATEDVCKDIMKTLGMDKKKTKFFKVSFNRPNIFWRVLPKNMKNDKDGIPQYVNFIAEYIKTRWLDCSGIIYCLSRDETEETAAYLREEHGLNVGHYHAGMTPKQRNVIQLAWKAGKVPVICATVAFGMGVDNAHVRFVVHQTMPKSVEGYYQESGRAGRDGKPSEALLLYSRRDVGRVKSLIWSGKAKKKSKQIQVDLVDQMKVRLRIPSLFQAVVANTDPPVVSRRQEYCENQFDCRRKLILSYFGETFTKHQCQGSCDNCKCKK
uniref:ATP-dependent DNA helicase n=1 Tax=Chloropicon primus TaxID=1764295 RepID=A0A7S2X3F7_9CHLO